MTAKRRKFAGSLRDLDSICKVLTGKRLHEVAAKALDIWGEDILKSNHPAQPIELPNGPYAVLGIHRDASDFVVKTVYRALVREYHPDTGTNPDTKKCQAVVEAYDQIVAERAKPKEG